MGGPQPDHDLSAVGQDQPAIGANPGSVPVIFQSDHLPDYGNIRNRRANRRGPTAGFGRWLLSPQQSRVSQAMAAATR